MQIDALAEGRTGKDAKGKGKGEGEGRQGPRTQEPAEREGRREGRRQEQPAEGRREPGDPEVHRVWQDRPPGGQRLEPEPAECAGGRIHAASEDSERE
eukprot:6815500-Alexandrium_andersonii.AAC.1